MYKKFVRACAPLSAANEDQRTVKPPPQDVDDLPPREVLERLAELDAQGMLEPGVLEQLAGIARKHGLRIPRHRE